jgi:hypothetical protein
VPAIATVVLLTTAAAATTRRVPPAGRVAVPPCDGASSAAACMHTDTRERHRHTQRQRCVNMATRASYVSSFRGRAAVRGFALARLMTCIHRARPRRPRQRTATVLHCDERRTRGKTTLRCPQRATTQALRSTQLGTLDGSNPLATQGSGTCGGSGRRMSEGSTRRRRAATPPQRLWGPAAQDRGSSAWSHPRSTRDPP